MPTPDHERPIPDHVEIPELPTDLVRAWMDLRERAEGKNVRWRRNDLNLVDVVDGRSAARALQGYRYIGRGWTDEAAEAPGQWQPGWIVLADRDGDPVIADLGESGIPILTAPHGEGVWRAKRAHDSYLDFIAAIKLTKPRLGTQPEPAPLVRDSSLTVLDWGPDRAHLVAELVRARPSLYQHHMFARKVEVPVVLTRKFFGDVLENVAIFIREHGGQAEVGPAIDKPHRDPQGQ